MKYTAFLTLLIFSCQTNDRGIHEKTTEQIYEECYKASGNMFKKIPEPDFKNLNVDQLCDEDTSFYEEKLDRECIKACRDVFNNYKFKAK